jgi:hypothetical protein
VSTGALTVVAGRSGARGRLGPAAGRAVPAGGLAPEAAAGRAVPDLAGGADLPGAAAPVAPAVPVPARGTLGLEAAALAAVDVDGAALFAGGLEGPAAGMMRAVYRGLE